MSTQAAHSTGSGPPDSTHTGAAPPWPARIALALRDIKLAHSVFALPFAILAAVLARPRADDGTTAWTTFALALALVIACMVAARTWAMLVNRLADHRFDADNPRTAARAIAAGRLAVRDGWLMAAASAAAFILFAACFQPLLNNWWPLALSVPVLAWIAAYSYAKRFSALCHLLLGSALAISPLAACLALRPELLLGFTPTGQALLMLAGFVMLWVAGFDIAYALQDMDFDRQRGLHSIPAALGLQGSLWTARTLHTLALLCLAGFAWREPSMGWIAALGVIAVGGLLLTEHLVLAKRGLAGLPMAFFTLNGIASCAFGLLACIDALV